MARECKPGDKAPRSGEYEIIERRGKRTGQRITIAEGEPFPPTPKKGQCYVIVRLISSEDEEGE